MANALYASTKELLRSGDIDWVNDHFKLLLVNTSMTGGYHARNADKFLCDIPIGTRVATADITNTSMIDGVAGADDVYFDRIDPIVKKTKAGALITNVAGGMVIYKDTGNEKTSLLVGFIDNAFGTFPMIPNGGDVWVNWDTGPNKIFKLNKDEIPTKKRGKNDD